MKEKKEKTKKKKVKYVDDGHTIYNMDIEGFKWHDRKAKKIDEKDKIYFTKREKFAILRAAFATYTPKFLIIILAFSLTALLLYFWLKY